MSTRRPGHSVPQTCPEAAERGSASARAMSMLRNFAHSVGDVARRCERLAPIGDVAIRLGAAWVFWHSGLDKLRNFELTLLHFDYGYTVPLPFELAAGLATGIELTVPVLLALGLATRASASVLFAFNVVAALSNPALSETGALAHLTLGALLLATVLRGPGIMSADFLFRRFVGRRNRRRRAQQPPATH